MFDQTAKRLNFYTNLDYVLKRILFLLFLCWLYMPYSLLYNHMFLTVCMLHIVLFLGSIFVAEVQLFSLTVLHLIVACRHKWPILYRTRQKQTHETNLHSILLTETKSLPGGGYRHFQASVKKEKSKGQQLCGLHYKWRLGLKQNWISCQGNICKVITNIFTLIKQKEISQVRSDLLR